MVRSGAEEPIRAGGGLGEFVFEPDETKPLTKTKGQSMSAEHSLRNLGIVLPPAPTAVGAYDPWVRTGNLVLTSGQLPWHDGKLVCTGKIGTEATLEQGALAARACAINAIAQLKAAVGDLDKVVRIVRLDGFVLSGLNFQDQPKVLNGASELFNQVFGPRGRHTRTAIGAAELPLNASVQLAVIAEVI
jgi:enamine deaminase RidA (YjgF/YER057c/UK114 family)